FGRLARISGVSAPLMKMPKNRALARGMFGLYDKGLRAIGGVPPLDAESAELGQYSWYCSSEKAERELGFRARDPGETLRDTVHELVERKVVAPAALRDAGHTVKPRHTDSKSSLASLREPAAGSPCSRADLF